MRLLTIQPVGVWNDILKLGKVFRCDPSSEGYSVDFDKAYEWLSQKMRERIGAPESPNVTRPIWAWKYLEGPIEKFDFKGYNHSERCIALYLEIAPERVMLTDFNRWHTVLNDGVYFDCYDDLLPDEEYDSRLQNAWDEYDKLSAEERKSFKVASWDKVILGPEDIRNYEGNMRNIQATFWELKPSDIVGMMFLEPNPFQ